MKDFETVKNETKERLIRLGYSEEIATKTVETFQGITKTDRNGNPGIVLATNPNGISCEIYL